MEATDNNVAKTYMLAKRNRRQRKRRMRRYWVRPWLEIDPFLGQYERLTAELREEDVPAFRNLSGLARKCFGNFFIG